MTSLTPRQREVLDYLGAFHARDGRFPTGPEIAAHFGFRDPSPAYQHLDTLEAKGYLRIKRYGYGRPRAIRFTTQATGENMSLEHLSIEELKDRLRVCDEHIAKHQEDKKEVAAELANRTAKLRRGDVLESPAWLKGRHIIIDVQSTDSGSPVYIVAKILKGDAIGAAKKDLGPSWSRSALIAIDHRPELLEGIAA